jgi:microcystin-dependent protein
MMPYGAPTAPAGWLPCDGRAVSRTTFATLFSIISTNWGAGDGSSTFNVPDFRGRVPLGVGTGDSGTLYALGAKGGEEKHQLLLAELALHAHAITDLPHNHTQSAHNHLHSDPGHSHGLSDPGHLHAITDPGHSHTDKSGVSNLGGGGTQAVASSANVDTGVSTTGINIVASLTGITLAAALTGVQNVAATAVNQSG